MAQVMVGLGVFFLLFGSLVLAWALRKSEPIEVAFRYHGAMFMAMGAIFVVNNVFAPDGRVLAVVGALAVAVFWSGWKHVSLLRREAARGRDEAGAARGP
jgi:hypothetical protein